MIRTAVALSLALGLAGCVTVQKPGADGKLENIRSSIARATLRTPEFGSISLIKAKIINAKISGPVSRQPIFGGNPNEFYCVSGAIENPLFPLNQSANAQVSVSSVNGQRVIDVTASRIQHCTATEPFPELEELSVARYKQ